MVLGREGSMNFGIEHVYNLPWFDILKVIALKKSAQNSTCIKSCDGGFSFYHIIKVVSFYFQSVQKSLFSIKTGVDPFSADHD